MMSSHNVDFEALSASKMIPSGPLPRLSASLVEVTQMQAGPAAARLPPAQLVSPLPGLLSSQPSCSELQGRAVMAVAKLSDPQQSASLSSV